MERGERKYGGKIRKELISSGVQENNISLNYHNIKEIQNNTGREKKGLWMLAGKRGFHLRLPGKAYREGDCIMETEQMRLFGNFLIPFYLISESKIKHNLDKQSLILL